MRAIERDGRQRRRQIYGGQRGKEEKEGRKIDRKMKGDAEEKGNSM